MDFQPSNLPLLCGPAVEIVQELRMKYEEVPVLSMYTPNSVNPQEGRADSSAPDIVVWYNPTTGTGTVTINPQPGVMCIVLAGSTKSTLKGTNL